MSEQNRQMFNLHIRDSKSDRVHIGSALLDGANRLTLNMPGLLAFPIHGRPVAAPWAVEVENLEKLAEVEA